MTRVVPALFTSTSRRPCRSIVSSTMRRASSWSLMSPRTYDPPTSSATARPASTDEDELTTTCAPSAASARAIASPIPLDEPVTIATLPSSLLIAAALVVVVRAPPPKASRWPSWGKPSGNRVKEAR
jgi:hypothetical protein